MIIAHPPCTYLSNAGAVRLFRVIDGKHYIFRDRFEKGMDAKEFFLRILNANCTRIAVENPVPSRVYRLPKQSQAIQPWQFGEPWSKLTYLWLRGLPQLHPTDIVGDFKPYISCGTSRNKGNKDKAGASRAGGAQKMRSKTFPGIAKAMAEQWGNDHGQVD